MDIKPIETENEYKSALGRVDKLFALEVKKGTVLGNGTRNFINPY